MSPRCFFIGVGLGDNPVADHFRALSEELVGRGYQCVILSWPPKPELEHPEGNPAVLCWPSPRPTALRDFRFLCRLVRRRKPSCLVANFGAVNVMTLTGWLAGVPRRVAWYHTLSTQQRADSSQPAWQRGLFDLRKSLVYAAATHVVGNSRAAVADVQRVHHVQAHKCRVFPNSLADPVGHDSLLGRERSGDKVLCAGRLWPSKGQDVLIESLGLLRSRAPGLRVEFAGEGPAKDRLFGLARERRVLDRCCFLGRLPHREVLCRMAESALTVVPSRSEAFGLVVIESMAVGTPAVASAVGGIPEIIRDGVDGFLVPPDDPAALADKIGLLLSNAELRHKMGLNARERFLSRFEQSRVVKEQADWLEQIVAAGRSSTIGRSS